MFRTAHPKDVGGLLSFAARTVPDHAFPYHRLGSLRGRPASVARAVAATALPRRSVTHTLVVTRGREAGGMAVLRGQTGMSTWEIEHLLAPTDAPDICSELLARLDSMVVRRRGARIFLRLPVGSPMARAVAEAGYRTYSSEELYTSPSPLSVPPVPPSGVGLEARRSEHDFPLFRLFTAATPVTMRAAEGLTFREWQEASAVRWLGARRVRDTVARDGGRPMGWLRTGEPGGRTLICRLVIEPDAQDARDALMNAIADAAPGKRDVRVVAPSHEGRTRSALEDRGFRHAASFQGFVHQVGERVLEGAFVPAGL